MKQSLSFLGELPLKLGSGLAALALTFIIAFSTAGLIQQQLQADVAYQSSAQNVKNQNLSPEYILSSLTYAISHCTQINQLFISAQNVMYERAPLPVNSTRTQIYNFVAANPGVQFRAICSSLGLSIGVVQFHLAQLQKSGLVTSLRRGRYKRFFVAGQYSLKQMEAIAAFRLQTVKRILLTLLNGQNVSHHRLAVQVQISSQGLTWQMSRLKETGLIVESRNGLNVAYALKPGWVSLVSEAALLVD
jgi:predicted transcriptional regulator